MIKSESDKCAYLTAKLLKMLNIDTRQNISLSYVLTAIINRLNRREHGSK